MQRRVLVIDDNPDIHADIRKILAPESPGNDALFARWHRDHCTAMAGFITQLEVLGRHGCDLAQGYYFCKPICTAECEELLIDLAARTSFTDTLRLCGRSRLQ